MYAGEWPPTPDALPPGPPPGVDGREPGFDADGDKDDEDADEDEDDAALSAGGVLLRGGSLVATDATSRPPVACGAGGAGGAGGASSDTGCCCASGARPNAAVSACGRFSEADGCGELMFSTQPCTMAFAARTGGCGGAWGNGGATCCTGEDRDESEDDANAAVS